MKIFSPGKRGIVFRRMLSIHLLLCICSILLLGSLLVNQLLRVTDKIDSVREADIAANCASQANILADYSRGAIICFPARSFDSRNGRPFHWDSA